jgi:hypothetical protein
MIGRLTLVALLAGAAFASPAAGQARCSAPAKPGWHSCLTASHRASDDERMIRLTKVQPRLVMRYEDGCPSGADRRTVVIRTAGGDRIARARMASTCRRGIARWSLDLELEVDLRAGTVVRSFWSGIPDNRKAPRVKLNAR